jgi:hypothetical protein
VQKPQRFLAIPNPKRREFREGSRTQERRGTPSVLAPGERKIKPGGPERKGVRGFLIPTTLTQKDYITPRLK